MGGPVGANGETAVADDDLDVQVGQANGITCNFKTPFCKEGVRAGQRDLADGGQTGCRTEEVLFGNADIGFDDSVTYEINRAAFDNIEAYRSI